MLTKQLEHFKAILLDLAYITKLKLPGLGEPFMAFLFTHSSLCPVSFQPGFKQGPTVIVSLSVW